MKDKKEEKCESETSVESNLRKHVKHYDKADISWPVKGDLRIPEKVFRECFENCKKFNGTSYKHLNKLDRIMKYCYKKKKLDFSFRKARPFSSFHLLTAAEIALNNRNYRTLYEIINKCLTLPFDYPFIWQQMKNYFILAVLNDPVIQNKEEVIDEFMSRVIMLDADKQKKKFLRDLFSLEINRKDDEEDENHEEELQLDEDSDVSNDVKRVFSEIKRENVK